jgi:hypothetical protein
MNRFKVLGFLLLISTAAAAAGLDIQKGDVDLLKSEALSRPFTVFEQLLYSLEKEAIEDAKDLQPVNNDFKLSRLHYPSATVTYEKKTSRVGVTFPVTVSGMNDPWREVCERHIRYMALSLGVLGLGSQATHPNPGMKDAGVHQFFSRYLGPSMTLENTPVASLRPFLDAVVVIVSFSVERTDKKGLAYIRQCALDIKSDHMEYFEHKY